MILTGGVHANAPEDGGDTVNTATLERIRYGIHLQKKMQLPILVTGGATFGQALKPKSRQRLFAKILVPPCVGLRTDPETHRKTPSFLQ